MEGIFCLVVEIQGDKATAVFPEQGRIGIIRRHYDHFIPLCNEVIDHVQPEIIDRPGAVGYEGDATFM